MQNSFFLFCSIFFLFTIVSLFPQEATASKPSLISNPCEDSLFIELELEYSHYPDSLTFDEKKLLRQMHKDCDEFTNKEKKSSETQKDYKDKIADSYESAVKGYNAFLIIAAIVSIVSLIYLLTL